MISVGTIGPGWRLSYSRTVTTSSECIVWLCLQGVSTSETVKEEPDEKPYH